MDAKPRFGFLISAYQTEQYVRGTLDSVISQTCGDWEVIVVDNGNSDAIAAIVGEYIADPRIKLVRHENRGIVGGVTSAAEQATGRYLCVLHSDDQLMPEFCAAVGKFLDSDPAIDAVCVDAYQFEDEGGNLSVGYLRSIRVKKRSGPSNRLTMVDVLGGFVPYYTAAIRRETWDAVGGWDPGIPDVDASVVIWLRMVGEHDVRLLPDRLARYRLQVIRTAAIQTVLRNPQRKTPTFVHSGAFAVGSGGSCSAGFDASQHPLPGVHPPCATRASGR